MSLRGRPPDGVPDESDVLAVSDPEGSEAVAEPRSVGDIGGEDQPEIDATGKLGVSTEQWSDGSELICYDDDRRCKQQQDCGPDDDGDTNALVRQLDDDAQDSA